MTRARAQVLAAIRDALGAADPEASARVAERIVRRPAPILPAAGALAGAPLVEAFVIAARRAAATVEDVGAAENIPGALARFLRAANLPARLRMGADRRLARLPWDGAPALVVAPGAGRADDTASLTLALAGVAETGTVVQASGTDNPSTLVCLPETHVVALGRESIVGAAEHVWALLRGREGGALSPARLPRALHWITGPSRTADIEQTLLMGAHGPRRLHILIADGL